MPWQRQGSIRGPAGAKGDTGDAGPRGADGAAGPKGDTGDAGAPGAGIHLQGSEAAATIDGMHLNPHDGGKAWLLTDAGTVGGNAMEKGHLAVWDGTAWHDAGAIVGPPGAKGDQGDPGAQGGPGAKGDAGVRGTKWFIGAGAPGTVAGSATGDLYLDTGNGDVYELEP